MVDRLDAPALSIQPNGEAMPPPGAAAYVTVRALKRGFRGHLDTTPMEYLRRTRLHGTHEELLISTTHSGVTVGSIAAA